MEDPPHEFPLLQSGQTGSGAQGNNCGLEDLVSIPDKGNNYLSSLLLSQRNLGRTNSHHGFFS
jgi:hypothetical protein